MENQPAVYDEGMVSPAVYAAMIAVNERLASRGCTTVTPEQLLSELETYAQETGLSDADREMGKNKLTQLWLQSTIDYAAAEPNGALKQEADTPKPKDAFFTIDRKELKAAVALCMMAVERKSTIPILTGLRFRPSRVAGVNTAEITGTDLEQAVIVRCKAESIGTAGMVIAAKPLSDALRNFKDDGPVTVSASEIEIGVKKISAPSFDLDSYPEIPKLPGGKPTLKIPADTLRTLIARTSFAVSAEESRFTLNGALLTQEGTELRMIATDGHRLAYAYTNLKAVGASNSLVRSAGLKMLAKIAVNGDPVTMRTDDAHFYFECGDVRLVSRKLEGRFPDWNRVLPDKFKFRATLDTAAMKQALAAALPFTDRHAISLQFKKDSLTIATFNSENKYTDTIKSDFQATSEVIGVNCSYVLDYFRTATEPETVMSWNQPQTAMEFGTAEAGDIEFRYIVMPMRT